MLRKIGRLFVIKTRWEAWMVIYAIAVGAVERGQHYLQSYPGYGGWMLALACTGVVFLAGARILDSVKPAPTPALAGIYQPRLQRRRVLTGSRPRSRRTRFDSAPRRSLHKD